MSRVSEYLAQARADKRKVLIPYLVAGDPDQETTVALMHELVEQGADIIELGVPFSDPSSDGPVIQLAAERALRKGVRLTDVLSMVESFRKDNSRTPVVLMGYLNPLEIMGYEAFAERAAQAGVDGVLIVDLPASEAQELFDAVRPRGLDTIFLVAPTTSTARIESICQHSTGYLYYVSLKGVTGAAITDHDEIAERIDALRRVTELPVVVGFGIKDEESAQQMARISDGVIVGSALVEKIAALSGNGARDKAALQHSAELIGRLKKAIDNIK